MHHTGLIPRHPSRTDPHRHPRRSGHAVESTNPVHSLPGRRMREALDALELVVVIASHEQTARHAQYCCRAVSFEKWEARFHVDFPETCSTCAPVLDRSRALGPARDPHGARERVGARAKRISPRCTRPPPPAALTMQSVPGARPNGRPGRSLPLAHETRGPTLPTAPRGRAPVGRPTPCQTSGPVRRAGSRHQSTGRRLFEAILSAPPSGLHRDGTRTAAHGTTAGA